jgi:putative restriction endonuclease
MDRSHDAQVRAAAFSWLAEQVARLGTDVLPRALLAEGFRFKEDRVPLVGPQGIFKPRLLEEVPLSITTAPGGPYDDAFGSDNLLRYRYRGTDPHHPDNVGLRAAMEYRLPLVYFHGIAPARYVAAWPVFVVGDDSEHLAVTVAVDDQQLIPGERKRGDVVSDDATTTRRAYITALVRVRLHQRSFRERVLEAYQRQCAFCRLRHEELLDAAHRTVSPSAGSTTPRSTISSSASGPTT